MRQLQLRTQRPASQQWLLGRQGFSDIACAQQNMKRWCGTWHILGLPCRLCWQWYQLRPTPQHPPPCSCLVGKGLVRQNWTDQRWAVEMWRLLALVLVPTRMTCPTRKPQAVARTILWAQRQIKPALRGSSTQYFDLDVHSPTASPGECSSTLDTEGTCICFFPKV